MSSSIQTKAFAEQDVPDTRQHLVATNIDPQTKVAIDVDVLMSEEDCEREMTINIDQQTTTSNRTKMPGFQLMYSLP